MSRKLLKITPKNSTLYLVGPYINSLLFEFTPIRKGLRYTKKTSSLRGQEIG